MESLYFYNIMHILGERGGVLHLNITNSIAREERLHLHNKIWMLWKKRCPDDIHHELMILRTPSLERRICISITTCVYSKKRLCSDHIHHELKISRTLSFERIGCISITACMSVYRRLYSDDFRREINTVKTSQTLFLEMGTSPFIQVAAMETRRICLKRRLCSDDCHHELKTTKNHELHLSRGESTSPWQRTCRREEEREDCIFFFGQL